MKIFICCLFAALLSSAFAGTIYKANFEKNKEDNKALDKSSDLKSKRDASLLLGSYHGPSHKYLPPSSVSSSFDSYAGSNGQSSLISGVYNSDIGGGYRSDGFRKGHGHFGGFTNGQQNSGAAHGLGYVLKNSYHNSGHHDLGYNSVHFSDNGFVPQKSGLKGSIGSLSAGTFSHKGFSGGHVNSHALGHGYSTSENGYKSNPHFINEEHKLKPIASGGKYYSKVHSGTFPSIASNGFSSSHSFSNSQGLGLTEVHHDDHVHNGGQEHIYIIPSGSSNFGSGHQEVSEPPNISYLPPVQQHLIPSSNYGVPIINVGDTSKKIYHQYTPLAIDQGPTYAAGHKGLGHFSFTANKPQALHTSISGSSLKTTSFSKAPFKPSTFLGVKYEGSSHDNFPNHQYVPSSVIGNNPTGYDYPTPPDSLPKYQQENYPQSLEVQSVPQPELDSTYLPPNSEIASPNGNYLPSSNTYEV